MLIAHIHLISYIEINFHYPWFRFVSITYAGSLLNVCSSLFKIFIFNIKLQFFKNIFKKHISEFH